MTALRRGLPRRPGGPPWPPAGEAPADTSAAAGTTVAPEASVATGTVERSEAVTAAGASAEASTGSPAVPTSSETALDGVPLRRGLPRVPGGEPWPPASIAPAWASRPPEPEPVPEPATPPLVGADHAPAAAQQTGTAAEDEQLPAARPRPPRWAGRALVLVAGAVVLVGVAVLVARWLVHLEPVQGFLTTYPGDYPLPEGSPVGIPAWLSWQHFFNVFLLVLIVRTGWMVRRQQRPAAYWARRAAPQERVSIMSWAHQALDVFWVANGVLYVVLLFATGQWVRIVPTDWSVFPNAVSAGLQYLSLSWPTDNGWVHYNSLQQLAYFTTVFVAAPLAMATGVRMSVSWPSRPRRDRLFPVEVARRIHFPVMLYFVAFTVVHVSLVFATGALRNLNHMFAARDEVSWVGFWLFVAAVVVIAGAAALLRPLFLAPVARRFGTVSRR
ncbi:cytochrome b/b6 domain-containing protein [Isoptericola sp. b515]|uniref:cytochrome b/b6 domain-containing protein n=1 Tax=Isoptericola sp. b515 TaxID=3064652 RepID=UPI002713D32E|nr:cytochrome b/b6 domain-containing protein [Isoptericola sp. b515]MDO8148888.1 cytochrome b/b6 domain-containing protein [Isoptericola sp. b515]